MIYNRELFRLQPDRSGQPAEDLGRIRQCGNQIDQGHRQVGFAITGGGEVGNTMTGSLPFIWMNGGDIISADRKKATVNQPAAVEAVTFYTDFFKKGLSPASTLENDGNTNRRLFIANTVSAYSAVNSTFRDSPENPRIDIGIMQTPHPAGKQTCRVLGGWSYIVPKDAKNPAEAKKFLQFVNTSENQGFFTDTFPVRASALNLPRFNDPTLANFRAMLPYTRPFPVHKNWVQIGQAYFDGIQRILLGDQTVQKAMDQANDEIQALLGK